MMKKPAQGLHNPPPPRWVNTPHFALDPSGGVKNQLPNLPSVSGVARIENWGGPKGYSSRLFLPKFSFGPLLEISLPK